MAARQVMMATAAAAHPDPPAPPAAATAAAAALGAAAAAAALLAAVATVVAAEQCSPPPPRGPSGTPCAERWMTVMAAQTAAAPAAAAALRRRARLQGSEVAALVAPSQRQGPLQQHCRRQRCLQLVCPTRSRQPEGPLPPPLALRARRGSPRQPLAHPTRLLLALQVRRPPMRPPLAPQRARPTRLLPPLACRAQQPVGRQRELGRSCHWAAAAAQRLTGPLPA